MAGPLGVLPAGPAAVTTEVEEDIDGSPPWKGGAAGGCCRWVRQRPPPKFEEDVDGGPHGGRCQQLRQRPPAKLKKASMVGPLGVLPAGPAADTTEV
jgi:hypothetical protein